MCSVDIYLLFAIYTKGWMMDGWIYEQMDGKMYGKMNEYIMHGKWMPRLMHAWMDGCLDTWIPGYVDG